MNRIKWKVAPDLTTPMRELPLALRKKLNKLPPSHLPYLSLDRKGIRNSQPLKFQTDLVREPIPSLFEFEAEARSLVGKMSGDYATHQKRVTAAVEYLRWAIAKKPRSTVTELDPKSEKPPILLAPTEETTCFGDHSHARCWLTPAELNRYWRIWDSRISESEVTHALMWRGNAASEECFLRHRGVTLSNRLTHVTEDEARLLMVQTGVRISGFINALDLRAFLPVHSVMRLTSQTSTIWVPSLMWTPATKALSNADFVVRRRDDLRDEREYLPKGMNITLWTDDEEEITSALA